MIAICLGHFTIPFQIQDGNRTKNTFISIYNIDIQQILKASETFNKPTDIFGPVSRSCLSALAGPLLQDPERPFSARRRDSSSQIQEQP